MRIVQDLQELESYSLHSEDNTTSYMRNDTAETSQLFEGQGALAPS